MAHQIFSAIILDCETGGLNPNIEATCSVSLTSISLLDGTEISKYTSFIKPYGNLQYHQKAMDFTGITMVQLMKGKDVKQVVADLIEEFKKAHIAKGAVKPVLVGHNIGFDIGFIQKMFDFCKADYSKLLSCNLDGYGHYVPQSFDTMWLSRMKYNIDLAMQKYTLTACCEKNGIALTDAHDAANDVLSTKEMFLLYMNQLRNNSEGSAAVKKERKRDYWKI